MSLTPEQVKGFYVELTNMGKERVRASLDHGTFSPVLVSHAWDWLSEEEAKEKRRQEASNTEQMEIARRASEAAERAASEAARAAAAAERQATATEVQAAEARRANKKATIALITAIVFPIITTIVAVIGIWITHLDAHR